MMRVEIKGLRSASQRIKMTGERSESLRPVWPKIERYLREQFLRQFETDGAALGRPWKPLEARYAAEKAAEGLRDILVSTGGLRASYLGEGRWKVSEQTDSTLRVGSKHPLAHIHQRGTPRGHVPARPVLQVTAEMKREVRKMISDYLMNGTT